MENGPASQISPSPLGIEAPAFCGFRKFRAQGPFVVINAAAITPERMEIELFGTEPVNGHERKIGALEEAHGGTLFIDEVAEMPPETQNKILRVVVDQIFHRVGGASSVSVDVRII